MVDNVIDQAIQNQQLQAAAAAVTSPANDPTGDVAMTEAEEHISIGVYIDHMSWPPSQGSSQLCNQFYINAICTTIILLLLDYFV